MAVTMSSTASILRVFNEKLVTARYSGAGGRWPATAGCATRSSRNVELLISRPCAASAFSAVAARVARSRWFLLAVSRLDAVVTTSAEIAA
jgi:hypothetical protein